MRMDIILNNIQSNILSYICIKILCKDKCAFFLNSENFKTETYTPSYVMSKKNVR